MKSTRKQKRRLLFISLTIIILLVCLVSSVSKDITQIYKNRKEANNLSNKYESLLEKQKKLSSEVAKMQDPEYVVRYAKEKYLYSTDNEIIIRFD